MRFEANGQAVLPPHTVGGLYTRRFYMATPAVEG